MSVPLARRPHVVLVALTPESRLAIGGAIVTASPLPFRVGRESRAPGPIADGFAIEQRSGASPRTNDLYLREQSRELNVSREHFQILWDDQGLALTDRGSTCGTIVEGQVVGGEGEGGTVPLKDGDVIIVGTAFSPFIFKLRLEVG